MDAENWLPVVGFEGYYEVSDRGRVRSLDRVGFRRDGHRYSKKGRILSRGTDQCGYPFSDLRKNGSARTRRVHRLVAEAFIPNPDNLPWVLHWDDDKLNNRVENLRWGWPSENRYDTVRNGRDHNAAKTRCVNGHEFTEDNTRREPNGSRSCRKCHRSRSANAQKIRIGAEPKVHGTRYSYLVFRCRCDQCRGAQSQYASARYQAAKGAD